MQGKIKRNSCLCFAYCHHPIGSKNLDPLNWLKPIQCSNLFGNHSAQSPVSVWLASPGMPWATSNEASALCAAGVMEPALGGKRRQKRNSCLQFSYILSTSCITIKEKERVDIQYPALIIFFSPFCVANMGHPSECSNTMGIP